MSDYLGPYLLGPNDENQGIYTGDARELARAIPDESVDLIFTDPVYQNIDDYRWLAETASRVLKPNGHLLTYVTQAHLPSQLNAMQSVNYQWLFAVQLFGRRAAIWAKAVQACGQLLVWHSRNGASHHSRWVHDFIGVQAVQKNGHQWRKGLEESEHYIQGFSVRDSIILEPFCGGGTIPYVSKMLGRKWLAFEIDPDTAERARERVRNTQPPLFVIEPEQAEMEL